MADGLDLGKMYGPLPLGAWIAVVGGGLAIAYVAYKNNSSSSAGIDLSGVGGQTGQGVLDNTYGVPGVGTGGSGMYWSNVAPTGDNSQDESNPDNQAWRLKVENAFIAMGNYNAAEVDATLTDYLNGNPLSVKEFALITLMLARFGPPPISVPAPHKKKQQKKPPKKKPPKKKPPKKNPPKKKPPKKKPKHHKHHKKVKHYRVKRGDTLWGIAQKEYGNPLHWHKIYHANRGKIANPHWIYPGQVFVIP
jgi:LysM repeat protein